MPLAASGFSSYAITDVVFPPGSPAEIVPGIIYEIGFFFVLGVFSYVAYRLMHSIQNIKDMLHRKQLIYVLSSILIVISGELLFDVFMPLTGELRFFDVGPLLSSVFALSSGYAIARHKLLDIRIVIQRVIIYILLLTIIVSLYLLLTVLFGIELWDSVGLDIVTSGAITVIFGILGIPVIENFFRRLSDPIFFKNTYDYAEAIHELSKVTQVSGDFDTLILNMENTIAKVIRAESVQILLKDEENNITNQTTSILSIPVELQGSLIAHILLGKKKSGDAYSDTDMSLIATFSFHAANALSRVRLFKQVEKYADELELRVKERTSELLSVQDDQRTMLMELSHNLQTPLTVFQAKIDRMQLRLPDDQEVLYMQQSIRTLSRFIYDILSISTLDKLLVEENYYNFNLSNLLLEIVDELNIITSDMNIEISENVHENIFIYGSRKHIQEMIMNIVSNAVKYIGNNTDKKITVYLSTENNISILTIKDSGIGISPENLPYIFKRFYRVRANSSSQVSGSGLGLSIVNQIVTHHKGSIHVESVLGKGTVFKINIPVNSEK